MDAARNMNEADWDQVHTYLNADLRYPDSPGEFREMASQLVNLGLLVPQSVLTDIGPENTYIPSQSFLEAFNGHCMDTAERLSKMGARDTAWFGTLLATVLFWMNSARTPDEVERVIARGTRYAVVMAVYLYRAGTHRAIGIPGVSLFPADQRKRVKEWMGWG